MAIGYLLQIHLLVILDVICIGPVLTGEGAMSKGTRVEGACLEIVKVPFFRKRVCRFCASRHTGRAKVKIVKRQVEVMRHVELLRQVERLSYQQYSG